jgi:type IV pilus assembly protein PilA
MKTMQKGFTLIELMIVVAIIGILAAIAIPAYQDYTIKAQVSEGPNLAAGLKTAVAEYYAQNGAWPAAGVTTVPPTGLGFTATPSGKYETIDLTDAAGGILITYGSQANAKVATFTLALRPGLSSNGDIVWFCGLASTVATNVVAPTSAAATTVPAKYLPASCK